MSEHIVGRNEPMNGVSSSYRHLVGFWFIKIRWKSFRTIELQQAESWTNAFPSAFTHLLHGVRNIQYRPATSGNLSSSPSLS